MKSRFRAALVSVSDACRVACQHCFRADKGSSDLTIEVFERTLSRLCEVGVEQVCLTGGEPLDHPELDRLIRKAVQFGVRISIITGRAASLVSAPVPEWLQRVESIGLSFDSEYLVAAGVSSRELAVAVTAARSVCSGPNVYLHGTCFNLSTDEVRLFREVSRSGVELNVSPALLDDRLRERLGFTAARYSDQLASDLRLIDEVAGVTDRLAAKYCQLAASHVSQPRGVCRASRLYVSSSGYIRICPFDRIGQVSVFAPRIEIHRALDLAARQPPAVALACAGTCGAPD